MIGLIGKKVGMTQIFDDDGASLIPVTVIRVEPNFVIRKCTQKKNGYDSVLLASVDVKPSRIKKPFAGQFPEGVAPKRLLCEFRGFSLPCEDGQEVNVDIFETYNFVDITGTTKGKGFQGVMRRHGFHGGPKTHGSKFHRSGGSTGMAAFPAKIIKGTKMPGRMGNDRRTMQNLRLVRVMKEENALLVAGSVPGPNGGTLYIRSAVKKEIEL